MPSRVKLLNPDDVGYDLLILTGQSNMSGRGLGYNPTLFDPVDPKIWQYGNSGTRAGVVSLAMEPLSMHDVPSGMGPGFVAARWYAQQIPPNRRVMLVPVAHGGTGFEGSASFTWKRGGNGTNAVNLYDNMIAQTQAALAAAGPNARIAGALWLQGETDGDNNTSGALYQADLLALIDGMRLDLGLPTMPFVVGQMVVDYLAAGTRTAINAVHVDVPRLRTRCGFAYGPGAGAQWNNGDGNHYNGPGQRIMGQNMAAALLAARANVTGTAPVPPGAMTSTQNGASLTVTWARTAGRVTDYVVRYRQTGTSPWTTLTRAQSIDNTAVIPGLTLNTSYDVQVATVNEQGTSAFGATAAFTLVSAPGQTVGLTDVAIADTALTIGWTATAGATSYVAEYKKANTGTWLVIGTVTGTQVQITGLIPSTSYNVRITPSNAAGQGTTSAVRTTSTIATAVPDQVTGLTAGTATNTSQALSWNASVRATSYLVEKSTDGGTTWTTAATGITTASTTVTGLTINTTYRFRVSGVNATGPGTASAALIATTANVPAPAQVTGLAASNVTATSLDLAWNAVSGATLGYLVERSTDGGTTWTTVANNSTGTTYAVRSGVTPGSSVRHRVSAINEGGTGTPSTSANSTMSALTSPLDRTTSTKFQAVGVRRLRAGHLGFCLRVRRDSDNVEKDIGFVGPNLDTVTLLAFVGSASGFVVRAYDQSGGVGGDLLQTTTTAQPKVVDAGTLVLSSASLPGIAFGGAAYILSATVGLTAAAGTTTIGVVKAAAATLTRMYGEAGSAAQYQPMFFDDTTGARPAFFIRNDAGVSFLSSATTGTAVANGLLNQFSATDTTTVATSWVNGAQYKTAGYTRPAAPITMAAVTLGALFRTAASNFFTGTVGEILAFTAALSDTDRQAIEADQKAYYGTP